MRCDDIKLMHFNRIQLNEAVVFVVSDEGSVDVEFF